MEVMAPILSAAEALSLENTIIIDSRGGPDARERYLLGHVKGARFVNLETDLSQKPLDPAFGGRHPLPEIHSFAKLLGTLGITPSSRVVVYDDKAGANPAARFWWMMKAVGHVKIQVIDGGFEPLKKAGAIITSEVTKQSLVDAYPVTNWKLPTVDIDVVSRATNDSDFLIIDVRENYRYRGESEPIDLVAGHIPNAVNVPYIDNLNKEGNFLSAKELRDKYREVLKERSIANVIVHCGSGVTACHTLLALEQAGIPGANLYVGSWGEWSRREMPRVPAK